jgi:hypothetical protein
MSHIPDKIQKRRLKNMAKQKQKVIAERKAKPVEDGKPIFFRGI